MLITIQSTFDNFFIWKPVFEAIISTGFKFDDPNVKKLPEFLEPGMKTNDTSYLSKKIRCISVRFDLFAS